MAEFEPTRLSVAMRRRGMTQRDLAAQCMITSQHISMIERRQRIPGESLVLRFAEVLGFPIQFFFDAPISLITPDAVSFRSRRDMSSSVRDKGLGAGDIAASIITPDLNRRFTVPTVDVPDLGAHCPEDAAAILRVRWGLGYEPIQNMVHLLESKGVAVYWVHADSPALDAVSLWRDNQPFVVLNSLKEAGDGGRFDAAHELGHLVLHRRLSDLSNKEAEDQADSFASAFLLPYEPFQLECPRVPDPNALYRLKIRWKVSLAAMVMRGSALGIFTEWQKRQAFQRLNATGERTREKVPIPREQSKLHIMVFDALRKKGITPSAYAAELHLDPATIFELMPVASLISSSPSNPPKEIRRGPLRLLP